MMVDISSHVYKKFFLQKMIFLLFRKVGTTTSSLSLRRYCFLDIHTPTKTKLKNL